MHSTLRVVFCEAIVIIWYLLSKRVQCIKTLISPNHRHPKPNHSVIQDANFGPTSVQAKQRIFCLLRSVYVFTCSCDNEWCSIIKSKQMRPKKMVECPCLEEAHFDGFIMWDSSTSTQLLQGTKPKQ